MFTYCYENLSRIAHTESAKNFIFNVKQEYENKYQGKPIYALEYSQFKRFYIDGDRTSFQKQYFDRRVRLALLQLLSLCDDKYLDDLENILSSICDEFMWILPAHAFEDGVVAKYDMIDLFSAETAFYLAETVYILSDKLSEDIKNKIRLSIKMKVVDVFEKGSYYFEETHSNWAAVCGCGVGLAYLYLFPERFESIKERIFSCMEHYLLGIGEEGYCEEGINYWQYGFGFFALFYDVYTQLTGEYPEILKSKTVINELKYPINAQMADGIYLPYADGGGIGFYPSAEIIYAIKNLFGDAFEMPIMRINYQSAKALTFRILNGIDKFGHEQKNTQKYGTVYYKEREVFIHKSKNYSFTAKCGTNYELHNHNDVGAFQIVKDGKCLIADLGSGEYTKEYFRNPEVRFGEKVFACGSMSHSVPIIEGNYQKHWKPYRGKVVSQSENEIEMDVAGAYVENAQGMLIKYVMQENGVNVTYKNLNNQSVCYRFVSRYTPKIIDGMVVIENMKIISKDGLQPKLSEKEYVNGSVQKVKAHIVDFQVQDSDKEIEFFFSFED